MKTKPTKDRKPKPKRPKDINALAATIVAKATGSNGDTLRDSNPERPKN